MIGDPEVRCSGRSQGSKRRRSRGLFRGRRRRLKMGMLGGMRRKRKRRNGTAGVRVRCRAWDGKGELG